MFEPSFFFYSFKLLFILFYFEGHVDCLAEQLDKVYGALNDDYRWVVGRAVELAEGGDIRGAIASFVSDLRKVDEEMLENPVLGIMVEKYREGGDDFLAFYADILGFWPNAFNVVEK